ncbi:ATP phosphoribosyltransferase regulatory subunit [Kordiimonas sp. SCSIO 12610]|uniref:ATP phosphoribosyltransferase regulatory subunit n=1 Tax=Kordiimonas sp. SCSIO 12610 TaxID=2829597 RepID=UPI00210A9365|nr:ATP phosphoribosyltransferase regulatory subunit [Kordiimonas sp. SCSIO 12610]UTW56461.1 ATP phosphoribosyltransferase regulatory subunit [Kordiimonas sp. SCSIO 12610]
MTGPVDNTAKNMAGRVSARQQVSKNYAKQALLPEGFRDQIGEHAEQEAHLVRQLVDTFLSHGYDRVSPPLVEYEDSLLAGPGALKGAQMFRLMDADTQRMMALRADMTVQISRLAATRLSTSPRPLRLAYAGSVLRTKGSQIRPTRQFYQAGFELIGSDSVAAEVEVIALACEALASVGLNKLSVDITLAPMIADILAYLDVDEALQDSVIEALDVKDISAFQSLPDEQRSVFEVLLGAAGPAETSIEILKGLNLSGRAGSLIKRVEEMLAVLSRRVPDVSVTLDPCESKGFEYKTGIGFAIFAEGGTSEIGRGGHYDVSYPDGSTEPATGFSVYLDSLLAMLPASNQVKKIYLPAGTQQNVAVDLRRNNWRTIQGLTEGEDSIKEARRLNCSHALIAGEIEAI